MTVASPLARLRPALWFAGLLVLIVLVERTITLQPVFRQRPVLPLAVLFDLLVGVPALFYVLVVRRYQWPLSTVAAAVGACLALVHWLIPAAQQEPLRILHWLPAVLEMVTLAVLAGRAGRLVRAYQASGATEAGFLPRARVALLQVLGLGGALLVAELDMLRYAVLGWGARPKLPEGTAFSNHQESGFNAFVVMLAGGLTVETAAVHLLVQLWSPQAAGWLLCLDGYSLLLVIAHGHAVRLSPTVLTADSLTLRVGFIWSLTVPRPALVAIEPLRDAPPRNAETLVLTKLLFTTPNLLLTFAAPVVIAGPYGIRRTARRVAVYLDQPQQFIAAAALLS